MGGRCAVIVPDGVLFGSSNAHINLRQKLVKENRLDGVVSMPGGVFKPYAGVSTAILLFTRGATTERIWFYDMAHDGFSLDDKCQPLTDNDIPDILTCWHNRHTLKFQTGRQAQVEQLKTDLTPLKTDRLAHQAAINRLTFESVIAKEDLTGLQNLSGLEAAKAELAELEAKIAPLQRQLDQLTRQFWVSKQAVVANKYDLSASRYRQIEPAGVYYEKPEVTMERLLTLEQVMAEEIRELRNLTGLKDLSGFQR